MTSYFNIAFVLPNCISELPNALASLDIRVAPIFLQCQTFLHTGHSEYMMATSRPLFKSKANEQMTRLIEANFGIRTSLQNSFSEFLVFAHANDTSLK
jgi:hypothetical protein